MSVWQGSAGKPLWRPPCPCCHTRQLPGSQGTGGFQPGEGAGGNCWLSDRPLTPVSVPLRACSPPRDTEPTSATAAVVSSSTKALVCEIRG